jgi:hypothetical protein
MLDHKIHYRFDSLRGIFTPSGFVPAVSYHYVLVRSLGEDYDNLKTLSFEELEKIKRSDTENQVIDFEKMLYKYCEALKERCLPVTGIEVNGTSGLIIKSDKYKEILKDNIETNLKHAFNDNHYNDDKINIERSVYPIISNLTTADVLPNYVPLDLSFKPVYKYRIDFDNTKDVDPCRYTNIQRIESPRFKTTVDLNGFIEILNKDGFTLRYEQGYREYKPINNYDEYLEFVKANPINSAHNINMFIDFTDDNNVRR